ncbi:hypothetical protein GCM10011583_03000 [Streptomyces camponoticapitis]|uniref:Uncharacterized protein n=1 Tax=Streptomyces camponoticapitis TaxID=1616125 RepID=A0ABQ2DVN6_9ACTN|nr:DUF6415 family natural product biosynthesis protein [Streptomyces camponoticapitis]GGJ74902.1 hypothetical protein GCM10011583_03000 [Streptomyces camponoticapitis]
MNETGDVALPVDLVTISRTVEQALAPGPDLPERSWVDATTGQLLGQLGLLLLEDLGDTDPAPVRDLHRIAYRLLDRHGRPDAGTPPLHAYEYMRTLATVTHSVAALYARRRRDER